MTLSDRAWGFYGWLFKRDAAAPPQKRPHRAAVNDQQDESEAAVLVQIGATLGG